MTDIQTAQLLSALGDDSSALLAEMKRRAGVSTDVELAAALAVAQSTVSQWRKRGRIPEAAVLRAERQLLDRQDRVAPRLIAARAIALRLPSFWAEEAVARGGKPNTWLIHMTCAMMLSSITDVAYANLDSLEEKNGLPTHELLPQLLDDQDFLRDLLAWVRQVPMAEAIAREALSPPSLVRRSVSPMSPIELGSSAGKPLRNKG